MYALCSTFHRFAHILLIRAYIIAVIDRTALFVARSANPPQFEDKIREGQRSDPKFSFLNPADPYHAYYRHRMDKVAQGDLGDEASPEKEGKGEGEEGAEPAEFVDIGLEPPPPEFIMDLPNISSIDLCVIPLLHLCGSIDSFLQRYHETDRTLHRPTGSKLPCQPLCQGGSELSVRLPPAYAFALRVFQPVGGAIYENNTA
jgi:hypothetical protein